MERIQVFTLDDCEGKTIEDTNLNGEDFAISFTDGTYIIIHAYATDGWHGSGSHEIEKDEMIYSQYFSE